MLWAIVAANAITYVFCYMQDDTKRLDEEDN